MTQSDTPITKITTTVLPDCEPLVQLIDILFETLNHSAFDLLTGDSKAAAMEYVGSVIGESNGLCHKTKTLHEIDPGKRYLLFADRNINIDDVVQINRESFGRIGIVRVREYL